MTRTSFFKTHPAIVATATGTTIFLMSTGASFALAFLFLSTCTELTNIVAKELNKTISIHLTQSLLVNNSHSEDVKINLPPEWSHYAERSGLPEYCFDISLTIGLLFALCLAINAGLLCYLTLRNYFTKDELAENQSYELLSSP